MRKLDWEGIEDLLLGCAVLATGGGGRLESGLALARACWERWGPVTLVDPDELAEEDLVVSPYFVGAVAPAGKEEREGAALDSYEPLLAARALERFLGRPVAAVVATELGGGNTAAALAVARMMDRPLVDADPAGRAVPELFHSTFYLDGVPIAPFALASAIGDLAIVERVGDDFRAEAIARAFAVASGDRAGVADHPVTGRVARRALLCGTLSRAQEVGAALRVAREAGADPALAAARAGGGMVIFRGTVAEDSTFSIAGGLTHGEVKVAGRGSYRGRTVEIAFRNEHMVARMDGAVVATIPDLISLLEEGHGTPVLNPAIPAGLEVAVVVFPAPGKWRTARGLEVFGPRYLGLDEEYVPVEKRCRLLGLGEVDGYVRL
ncbi:MAG: DUF917 domain-containing protein [Bacillota bacterium]|nr:DUF917 domain-containing protein [Bacillota bacterium]MDI7250422.1 DUF917 domain-containing protein [Bacillota bacterium]